MNYSTKEPKDVEWCDICEDLLNHCFHGNYGSDTCMCELCVDYSLNEYIEDTTEQEEDILKKINNKPRNNT